MAYSLRLERTVDGNMAQDAEMLFHLRRNSGFHGRGDFARVMDLLQQEVTLRSAETYVKGVHLEREETTYAQRTITLWVRWFTVGWRYGSQSSKRLFQCGTRSRLMWALNNHNNFNHLKRVFFHGRPLYRSRLATAQIALLTLVLEPSEPQISLISYSKEFARRRAAMEILRITWAKHVWNHPASHLPEVSI